MKDNISNTKIPFNAHNYYSNCLFFQPKLTINQPNDHYEQEADAVAEQVIQSKSIQNTNTFFRPAAISSVQRKCAYCEEEEKQLQRKEIRGQESALSDEIENYVDGLNSRGASLNNSTKTFFESRMGYDFSNVRIHNDSIAAKSAQSINALAYTSGNNIVFNENQYQPESDSGKKLLAHELTHVVQQNGEPSKKIQRYSHEDCLEDDLRRFVWPNDYLARQMINKVIRVLNSVPNDSRLIPLYTRYFKTPTPNFTLMYMNFSGLKVVFDASEYQYECEDSCSGTDFAYVRGAGPFSYFSDIHLCMPLIRRMSGNAIAATIIHELSHKYLFLNDTAYCCDSLGNCLPCGSLSVDDALFNADSYACFAVDLYGLSI